MDIFIRIQDKHSLQSPDAGPCNETRDLALASSRGVFVTTVVHSLSSQASFTWQPRRELGNSGFCGSVAEATTDPDMMSNSRCKSEVVSQMSQLIL